MKNFKIISFAAALALCGTICSCGDDPVDSLNERENDDQEVSKYDYSEKGFFMNGQIKVKGEFPKDSIIEGYTKYVKRLAHYTTIDDVQHEIVLNYGLVVEMDKYAKFYSDDIAYNKDSTAITCNGKFEYLNDNSRLYNADITATIDTIGKPHLITCKTTVDGKVLLLQFRQTYPKNDYSDVKHPQLEDFDI